MEVLKFNFVIFHPGHSEALFNQITIFGLN